jgi:hypothetical protein
MLGLSPEDFSADWEFACFALEDAYKRITDTKNGYGIIDFRKWAPFTTMIVPLAAFIAHLEKNKQHNATQYQKIDAWYWASVFQNRYNEGVNTNTFADFTRMKEWFGDDQKIPDFVHMTQSEIDLKVESKSSATYKAGMSLIVLAGALDFQTGQPPQFAVGEVQDDHIFPKSLFDNNLLANRTLISTNQKKGNQSPSRYFGALETVVGGRTRLEEILATHLIDANGLSALLKDDLQGFIASREQAIRRRINDMVPFRQ